MKKLLLLFLIVVSYSTAKAHQDFWVTKEFGNVKVRIKTGYQFEEIKKIHIIGNLAKTLCEQLSYKKPILIDLDHFYVDECEPDFFISFDRGVIQKSYAPFEKGKKLLKKKGIVIRQVANTFDPKTTLLLLEYVIINSKKIEKEQRQITYNENYNQWIIHTITASKIKKIVASGESILIKKVLKNKIYRDESNFKFGYTYYWQNNIFTLIERTVYGEEIIIKKSENIYDFKRVGNCVFVFPTKSFFYTINKPLGYRKQLISKNHIIENASLNFRPYMLKHIGGHKYSIYFNYYNPKVNFSNQEITLLYDEATDTVKKI